MVTISVDYNTMQFLTRCITLWDRLVAGDPRELTYELTQFRRVAGASRLACTQRTYCGMRTSIFSHTQMTTRAGSLVYVRMERGRENHEGYKRTLPIISSRFWIAVGLRGLTDLNFTFGVHYSSYLWYLNLLYLNVYSNSCSGAKFITFGPLFSDNVVMDSQTNNFSLCGHILIRRNNLN